MAVRDVTLQSSGPRRFGWLGAVLGIAAVACLGTGCDVALADSGDFTAVVDGATDYILPAGSCDGLQDVVGGDPELVLACRIGGRPASPGPDDTPCDIVNNVTNAGLAVGQCLTSDYPNPFLPVGPGTGPLETDIAIKATAAGSNLALGDRDQISVTSATNGGRVLGLVDVQAGSCPTGGCPPQCLDLPDSPLPGIPVIASQPVCAEVRARLADSVLTNPPALSHVLFFDLEQTGKDDVLRVAVCDGYKWSCRIPGTVVPNTASGTSFGGQVPISIVDTPVCVRLARSTRCS